MNLSLTDQVAVIIGAASGIGRAVAEAFAAEGASVGLIDRNPAVESVARELSERHSVACRGEIADIVSEDSVNQAATAIQGILGNASHVVFTAGIGSGKFGFPFTRLDPDDWRRVLDVNVMGAVHIAHAFAPQVIAAAKNAPELGASLLFLVSVAGQVGSQTDPPYSAAKAAQINFAQCLARDLAPHGVRVNALSPGMVRTPLNESVWAASQATLPESERCDYPTWAEEKIRRVSPLGRWQEPAEFGAAAVFLASPHARNITGQTLNIDGGQVMHS